MLYNVTDQDGFRTAGCDKTFNNPADWKKHVQNVEWRRKDTFLVHPGQPELCPRQFPLGIQVFLSKYIKTVCYIFPEPLRFVQQTYEFVKGNFRKYSNLFVFTDKALIRQKWKHTSRFRVLASNNFSSNC